MNGILFLAAIVCMLTFVLGYLIFEISIFRTSCRLAEIQMPTVGRTLGIILVVLAVASLAETALTAIVTFAYSTGKYPPWEIGTVTFFLGLPLHLIIASVIHAKMAGIRLQDGISVWFIEKAMKFVILLFLGIGVGVVVMFGQMR